MHRKKRLGKCPIPFPSLATYDTPMTYPVYVRLTFLSSFHRHHSANVSCSSKVGIEVSTDAPKRKETRNEIFDTSQETKDR